MLNQTQLENILSEMTLEEKINMLHGDGLFETKGIKRLNIPPFKMSDGPMGVRHEFEKKNWALRNWSDDAVSYFPSNTALAATWNPDLAYTFGKSLGAETRSRGKDVILGPGINIIRSPLNGRNFEYMSEDPLLIKKMAPPIVKGIQENDVAACVKHFIANNQESNRMTVDVLMDERTFEEFYLPPFYSTIVEASAYTIMGAYNKLNGHYCCESPFLLQDILRKRWAYEGVVISDWGAVHSTKKAALSSHDIEMNVTSDFDQYYFANPLYNAVINKTIDEAIIDEKVRRILHVMNTLKMLSGQRKVGERNTYKHQEATLKTAEESIVLLENDGILPLDPSQIKSIAIIGENAVRAHATGGGSAEIKALYEHTPFNGISMLLGGNVKLTYAKGYTSDKDTNVDKQFELRTEAMRVANDHDYVIFVGGLNHDFDTEGKDRKDIEMPYAQNELLEALYDVNPNIITVNVSGSAVNLSIFKERSKALIQTWYNGMEGGRALAHILFGIVNPSGKLPFTIGQQLEDYAAHSIGEFPGQKTVAYSEGMYIGYRHFEKHNIKPLYVFGHGLSYTNFEYTSLETQVNNQLNIEVTLQNTGQITGKEVVQLYLSKLSSKLDQPKKALLDFKKCTLNAKETTTLQFSVDLKSLESYDPSIHTWILESGDYQLSIGSSSQDIKLTSTFHI